MATNKSFEAPGAPSVGLVWVTGWTAAYPQSESANVVYPMICQALPQSAPSSSLNTQAYYWVAPYPGKLISIGAVGISTPGTASNGAVLQLIKNGSLTGGGFNASSFSAKTGLILNLAFVAGDYLGIRYGCPYSGSLLLSATMLVQLTLPT